MALLRQHYLAGLPARRAALGAAWRDCADGGDEGPWGRLRDVAHKLAGSATSYGYEAMGKTARELDRALSGRTPARARAAVGPLVAGLAQELDVAIAA